MSLPRRDFIKKLGGMGVLAGMGSALAARPEIIAIITDPADPIASSGPVQWAAGRLRQAIEAKQGTARLAKSLDDSRDARLCVVVARTSSRLAQGFSGSKSSVESRESFSLTPGRLGGKPSVLASASDATGFVYALLELADQVQYGGEPIHKLSLRQPVHESPANEVRGITRAFVSEVEDKPWYYDQSFWRDYLSMLAAHRFNRFNLAFGMGWDFPRDITDDYFHFAYPFLLDVPGYGVRVTPLAQGERERNLEMLRFISDETAARGLEFYLGIWTHAYQWVESPRAAHRVEGLTPETHAAYCRDALELLLKNCPAIHGVTLRVHGESGVAEGSYDFWRTLFDGIVRGARPVAIDLHAKGLDNKMIGVALDTGMPVSLSPKFWAEHMGLGYHQTAIRELEMPPRDHQTQGFFSLSEGSRRFLRYGYGDLFRRDRRYKIAFRLWPGTQRMLLWGDPAMAAAYGRSSHFCGASGIEICEPLFFKGRKGSGLPGGRCAYEDKSLEPAAGDFQKYQYTYRVWGRLLYNPKADPESWRRYLRAAFGAAAAPVEETLANAGRVLPLITTAHLPSAANNTYWPEIYTNMPIVEGSAPQPYGDTPKPKRFGAVSPIDPGLFATIEEYATEMLKGERGAKYSPVEVAQWLEDFTDRAGAQLNMANDRVTARIGPEYRRFAADAAIEIGIGRFFAAKFRSGALFAIWRQSGHRKALEGAVASYQKARMAWTALAESARGVYRSDITYGPDAVQRGHWLDRLPAVDKDIATMEALLQSSADTPAATDDRIGAAMRECLGRPDRPAAKCSHTPAVSFRAGDPVSIALDFREAGATQQQQEVLLHYRHVNQAEDWQVTRMEQRNERYQVAIPSDYTNSPFALQYYFELRSAAGRASMYPGFGQELANQPYFVVQQV